MNGRRLRDYSDISQVRSVRDLGDTTLLGSTIASLRRDNRSRQRALSEGRTGRCSFAQYDISSDHVCASMLYHGVDYIMYAIVCMDISQHLK